MYFNILKNKRVGEATTNYNNFEHITEGEIGVDRRSGNIRVIGGHKAGNRVRVIEKLEEYSGGSYEARIEVQDSNNPNNYIPKTNNDGISTMFPDHWTENRIKVEINNILKNPQNRQTRYKWEGTSSSGVKIRIFLKDGKVTTAYPIKP